MSKAMFFNKRYVGGPSRMVSWTLFFIGLFSMTRINLGGSIAISEVLLVVAAPFVFFREWAYFKRYGVKPLVVLCFLWLLGAVFSDWYNETHVRFALKGIATAVVMLSCIICLFSLLKRDVMGYRWFVVGVACSYVLSTFFFSRASSLETDAAANAFEETINYKLYWVLLAVQWVLLPIKIWFLKVPLIYTFSAMLAVIVFSLMSGARSLFAILVTSFALILLAMSKTTRSMMNVKKHFIVVGLILVTVIAVSKAAYKYVASHGILGDDEFQKYERQTSQGDTLLKMLMAGRTEFFVSGYAAIRKPFVGHGSWAIDWDGIYPEFIARFGSKEDIDSFYKAMQRHGGVYFRTIPFHTHILTYWMWHGFWGLVFFSYVGWLALLTLKKYLHVIPELYGYFACAIPPFIWDLFFSPLSNRVDEAALYVLCALVQYHHKKLTGRRS